MTTTAFKTVAASATKGPGPRQFWFRASDSSVDRDGDTINPAGWDLANFLRAPVILWSHDHGVPAIARAVQCVVRDGALWILIEFPPPGIHPLADTVHNLVAAGFIVSMSVGFRPIKFTQNAQRGGVDFVAQELLEASIVNVGSNPNALLQSRSLAADKSAVLKWLGGGGGPVVLELADPQGVVLDLVDEPRHRRFAADPLPDPAEIRHILARELPGLVKNAMPTQAELRELVSTALARARGRVD